MREERRWQHLFTDGTKLRDKYLEMGREREPRNLPGIKTAHGEIPGKERDSGKKMGHMRKGGNNGILGKGILGFSSALAAQSREPSLPSRGMEVVVGVN